MNKLLRLSLLLACLALLSTNSQSQLTVGVTKYIDTLTYPGYNLYFPHGQRSVFLIDNCGRIVKQWDDGIYSPGNSAYIMENGDLMKTGSTGPSGNQWIFAGGAGQVVQLKTWDDQLLWEYEVNDSLQRMHHDIAPMPNGNVLIIAWDRKNRQQSINEGRDTAQLTNNELWPDKIIEVEMVVPTGGNIVWEWHAWDHLIQDFDSTKANYGVVSEHPELIDLNFGNGSGTEDWLHINSINYNPVLDQIVVSIPNFNEMWIIDHSTTTQEAASHAGGKSGIGGDLMFRWGNPLAYDRGQPTDQKLSFQHDVRWVDPNATPAMPDFGEISCFNNRIGVNHSAASIIIPPWDNDNWQYLLDSGKAYDPAGYFWHYTAPSPNDLFSGGLSSVQKLKNGNTLVCSGRQGWTFELGANDSIVWQYRNPLIGGVPLNQGDPIQPGTNIHFRFERYHIDYPGFNGKSLEPGDYIEGNPDTTLCPLIHTGIQFAAHRPAVKIYPNPADNYFYMEGDNLIGAELHILDMQGRTVHSGILTEDKTGISTKGFTKGVYLVRLNSSYTYKLIVN